MPKIYYSDTNPAYNTNPPYAPFMWVNRVSGELFVCIDNTKDYNVWQGQSGTLKNYDLWLDEQVAALPLYAWWDISDISTLYQNDGVSPVTSDYQSIGKIVDKSDNGFDLVRKNTVGPTYRPNEINGYVGANLVVGSNQELSVAFTKTQPVTYYLIFKAITWGSNRYVFGGYAQERLIMRQTVSGTNPEMQVNAGINSSSINSLAVGTVGVICIQFNKATSRFRHNLNTPVTGDFGSSVLDGITLGGNYQNNYECEFSFGELKIYDGIHSQEFEDEIILNMMNKWGIS